MYKTKRFSLLLGNNSKEIKTTSPYSVSHASKYLVYFGSVFGMQTIKFSGNGKITGVTFKHRMHSVIVIITIAVLLMFIRPVSWHITKSDLPLNILTKTFGILHTLEVIYSIINSSFSNSQHYVKLFRILDDIDDHLIKSQSTYDRTKVLSVVLIFVSILQLTGTFCLIKFHVFNMAAHFTFFLVMLQGAITMFLTINIYFRQLIINSLLLKKVMPNVSPRKRYIFKTSTFNELLARTFFKPSYLDSDIYCWFELMQLYDKVTDCIHWFNKIYAGQVCFMFNSWLVCTLLTICRSISPSMKQSEAIVSDIFMYMCISGRPMFLVGVCELLIRERRKTLSILLHSLVYENEAYLSQIDTMIQLVETKRMEILAFVFTADVVTALDYTGRVISYAVIFIQYFYINVF